MISEQKDRLEDAWQIGVFLYRNQKAQIEKGTEKMDRAELEKKLIECVAIAYSKDAASLTLDTSFKNDLGGASVQMVGLVSQLENELDVFIQLADAAACETIKDLVDKVEAEL